MEPEKTKTFQLTLRVPNGGYGSNDPYGLRVPEWIPFFIEAIGGKHVGTSQGSAARYSYMLYTYEVPTNKGDLTSLTIDVGSETRAMVDFSSWLKSDKQ